MKLKQSSTLAAFVCLAVSAGATVLPDTTPAAPVALVEGTVKGRIEFEGDRPELKPLEITEKQAEGCCPPGVAMDTTDRSIVIDDKGGLANVVITVTVDGQKAVIPDKPVEIDQKKCHFEPHVQVAPVGADLVFLNSDAVTHNIHVYAMKNKAPNQAVAAGKELGMKAESAEPIKVQCDLHPWMSSYIIVTDATQWAVSGPDGSFEIAGLPAGTHQLEIWHETLGKSKAEVIVKDDGSSELVTVKMSADKKGGGGRRRR
jgi:plastocyanin